VALSEALEENAEVADLRRALVSTQRQLAKAKAKTDDLVAATITAAHDATIALGPIKPTPAPTFKAHTRAEVALWDTGDWQYSKLTPSYSSAIADQRIRTFVSKAQALTELHRKGTPVDDGVVVFGGDMVEGLFNFPSQVFEIDATIFEQYVRVGRLLVEVVQGALSVYKRVTVVAEWGNHGRIGSKRDAVPRADNIDRMAFELARQLLEGEKRLTWQDSGEDVQRIEIGNYRALVMHGDEIGRNGFASPTTMRAHVERWKSGAYRVDGKPWPFRDVYSHHYHTHCEWALADGEGSLFQTGSTESDNRYANIGMASAAIPSQRVHFIDPDKGRVTAQYKVWVD
jgi:hypothetical protein